MRLRPFLLSAPVLVAVSVWTAAHAIPVIVNGDFETTSLAASAQVNTTNVTGWSTTGYNFLFFPGTATTTGAASVQYGQFYLSGALASGASNGFTPTSPTGGNFLAADGDFQVGAITQTITNPAAEHPVFRIVPVGRRTAENLHACDDRAVEGHPWQ